MKVKIDTKEKMYVITLQEEKLTANMTGELNQLLLDYLKESPANVIVNFRQVNEMDLEIAKLLTVVQQRFYDENHSLVYCHFKPAVADFFRQHRCIGSSECDTHRKRSVGYCTDGRN